MFYARLLFLSALVYAFPDAAQAVNSNNGAPAPAVAPAAPASIQGAASVLKLGAAAPDFSAVDLEGNLITLSDFLGAGSYLPPAERKVVMLILFRIPCKACEEEVALIKTLRTEFKLRNVEFLYMNVGNSPKEVRGFVKKNNLDFKLLLDEENANYDQLVETFKFKTWFPVSLVLAPNGKLVGPPLVGITHADVVRKAINHALTVQ